MQCDPRLCFVLCLSKEAMLGGFLFVFKEIKSSFPACFFHSPFFFGVLCGKKLSISSVRRWGRELQQIFVDP